MPQMAPINWLSLFIMFTMSLVLFSLINYFMVTPQSPKTYMNKNNYSPTLTWKW